jgi:hypothetical protein
MELRAHPARCHAKSDSFSSNFKLDAYSLQGRVQAFVLSQKITWLRRR